MQQRALTRHPGVWCICPRGRRVQSNRWLIRKSSRAVTRLKSSPLEIDNGKVSHQISNEWFQKNVHLQAGDWLNLAFPHNQGFKDESDVALKEALNEVCNMTLVALLKEEQAEIHSIEDELYSLGTFFSEQGPFFQERP